MNINKTENLKRFGSFILPVLIFFFSVTSAQNNVFTRVFYDNISAKSTGVIETTDKGYIICGEKDNEGLLMKTDSNGNMKWTRRMGISSNERYTCLLKKNDSTYLAAGKFLSPNSNLNVLITQFNNNGDTIWNRCYDLGYQEEAMSIAASPDGGFIIATVLLMTSAPNNQIGIVKLDANGQLQWAKKLSYGTNADIPYCIQATADTNYYLSGYTENYPPFDADGFLMKLNTNGNIVWSKKYQIGNTWSQFRDFKIKGNSIYGLLDTGDPKIAFLKTDLNGNVLNHKIYQNLSINNVLNEQTTKINFTHDDGFILSTKQDILKIDSLGNPTWNQFLQMYITNTIETSDHGFLACGNGPVFGVLQNTNLQNPHIGIIKTDSMGYSPTCITSSPFLLVTQDIISEISINFNVISNGIGTTCSPVIDTTSIQSNNGCVDFYGGISDMNDVQVLQIYPNPANDHLNIQLPEDFQAQINHIEITNITGQIIAKESLSASSNLEINTETFSPGWYSIHIANSTKKLHSTFIICR